MKRSVSHLACVCRCEGKAPPFLLPAPGLHVADVDPGRGLRHLVVAGAGCVLALSPVLVTARAAEAATRPLPGSEATPTLGGALGPGCPLTPGPRVSGS